MLRTLLTLSAAAASPCLAWGQSVAQLTERLVAMTAVSGFEQAMADTLTQILPGAQRDRAGNVVARLGSGEPHRLAACPMDEWGYVVGRVHDDGYLTLRRVGRGAVPPLFDQGHEGHRVTVWGSRGPVPAVVGVPSTHLRRGRQALTAAFTVDDAWVDLGAASAAEARAAGVEVLAPVALEKAAHRYGGDGIAGPEAGQRGACAALAAAYLDAPGVTGTVTLAFTVESRIGHRGLSTVANANGPFAATLLLAYPLPERMAAETLGQVERRAPEVRHPGWPVETVRVAEVEALAGQIREWMRREVTP